MSILRPDDIERIRAATREELGTAIEEPRLYRLGKLRQDDGAIEIKVVRNGFVRPGEVWVRAPGDGAGDAVPAVNTVLSDDQLIFNRWVEVKPYRSGLRIVALAPEDVAYAGNVNVSPQRVINDHLLDIGLLRPSQPASMTCVISRAVRNLNNTLYLTAERATKDFTEDIPGADAIGVFIEINPDTGTLHYTNSSSFDPDLSLDEVFDDLPRTVDADRFAVGYVKLYPGQEAIRRGDILPARDLLAKAGAGGGPGAMPDYYHGPDGAPYYFSDGSLVIIGD